MTTRHGGGFFRRVASQHIALLALLLCLPLAASAEVKEYRLDNGLKVLIAEDHKAPVATFQIWYRVGSRNEPAGKTGISHLLEHMMFKGTPEYGSKVFSRLVQKNGGIDNAYTTRDYTAYYQVLASDRIGLSVRLEADRMENLLLAPADVRDERSVVMEERRMRYEDDPQSSLYEEVVATAFKVHPYHNPVIGWMSELASIGRQDLLRYYKRFYSPDNAVIIVAGDVKADELIREIRESFGGIPRGPEKEPVTSEEPPQKGEKRIYLRKEAKLPYVMAAYHVPGFPDSDSAAIDVLASILSGKSGRLYRNLVRDKKVALNAYASYSGLNVDPYLFFIEGTVPPGGDAGDLEKALYEEIDRLKETAPSEREVQKAKNQMEAAFIMGQDSISFQARVLGVFEMLGDWRLKDRYIEAIRGVTPEDVQRVARKYFTRENRTVGILIPEGG
ncbi:MAG TPA: insulinase family protein [Nitrospirae bacterium]|nr:insulinase family protein [Nitrospirota bacterium]